MRWNGGPELLDLALPELPEPALADPCSNFPQEDMIHLSARVEQEGCSYFATRSALVSLRRFTGPYSRIPLFIIQPRPGASLRSIRVYAVGGPGDHITILGSAWGDRLAGDAQLGVATVVIGYLGTASRTLFPRPSLSAGANEVRHYLMHLRRRYPAMPISLVGQSAGALVVLESARNLNLPTILLAPILRSHRDQVSHFARTISPRQQVTSRRRLGLYEIVDGRAVFRGSELVLQVANYRNWSAHSADLSFLQRLPPPRRHCLFIIAGDADRTIGLDHLPAIQAARPDIPLALLPGVEHLIASPRQVEAVHRQLRAFEAARCPIAGEA